MCKSLITGIDISASIIRAVVLSASRDNLILLACQEVSITEELFSTNYIFNYPIVVNKFRELKSSLSRLKNYKVAMSVPDNRVMSKVVSIDSGLVGAEIQFAIEQAFATQSPFPIQEMSIDFVKLDNQKSVELATTQYCIYATHKDMIKDRVRVLHDTGFTPLLIEGESHSLLQICDLIGQDELISNTNCFSCHFLLHIDELHATLCSIFNRNEPFYKTFSFSLSDLNKLGVVQFSEQICQKLHSQIQLISSSYSESCACHEHVTQRLWISGAAEAATIDKLSYMLKKKLDLVCMPLDIASLLYRHRIYQKTDQKTDLGGYEKAIGLAIRGIEWSRGKYGIDT